MNTPICDFVRQYRDAAPLRMHMPGHKGAPLLGPEPLDITEIAGADDLYHARGVIRRSEENAAALFGAARTLYSAEGSSLCIRAMVYLATLRGAELGLPRRLLAGRNAHKTLMTAAALLDLEIDWLSPGDHLLGAGFCVEELEKRLAERDFLAVYLTSPDYLGGMADIRRAAAICRRAGTPLMVDNAHGAYLKFLDQDSHPMTPGAAICCDSAHKTLPCLTGAAYLHIGRSAPEGWVDQAEGALALFGSTSPSWLILQSLDRVNPELAGPFPERLSRMVRRLEGIKKALRGRGWALTGEEPGKLTLAAKSAGYTGLELGERLRSQGVECEFADPDFVVLMPSAWTGEEDWNRLERALENIPLWQPIPAAPPQTAMGEQACTIRQAVLAPREEIPVERALGRVLAEAYMGCPPAVPICTAGERITLQAIQCFQYYGVKTCQVIR